MNINDHELTGQCCVFEALIGGDELEQACSPGIASQVFVNSLEYAQ